jgi:hypothetical protein
MDKRVEECLATVTKAITSLITSAENEAEAYGYLMLFVASFDKTFRDAADIAMDEIKSRKTEGK